MRCSSGRYAACRSAPPPQPAERPLRIAFGIGPSAKASGVNLLADANEDELDGLASAGGHFAANAHAVIDTLALILNDAIGPDQIRRAPDTHAGAQCRREYCEIVPCGVGAGGWSMQRPR